MVLSFLLHSQHIIRFCWFSPVNQPFLISLSLPSPRNYGLSPGCEARTFWVEELPNIYSPNYNKSILKNNLSRYFLWLNFLIKASISLTWLIWPWVMCSLCPSLASNISLHCILFSSHTALFPVHKYTMHPPATACVQAAPLCLVHSSPFSAIAWINSNLSLVLSSRVTSSEPLPSHAPSRFPQNN